MFTIFIAIALGLITFLLTLSHHDIFSHLFRTRWAYFLFHSGRPRRILLLLCKSEIGGSARPRKLLTTLLYLNLCPLPTLWYAWNSILAHLEQGVTTSSPNTLKIYVKIAIFTQIFSVSA